ncbi:MAG TPA: hypothetical protein VFS41_09000 [Edaphobacter sp.]|nr:hypothetical protein [Edaphobacter sp.]
MDDSSPKQTSRSNLALAWIILGCTFVLSLIASVVMIARTINWIRLRGTTVPPSYTALTQVSEWIFGLSSAGLLLLVVMAILRSYRDR